jgi:hypothetical protein
VSGPLVAAFVEVVAKRNQAAHRMQDTVAAAEDVAAEVEDTAAGAVVVSGQRLAVVVDFSLRDHS